MTWFESLTGIPEITPSQVREQLTLSGTALHSRANGKTWTCGQLEIPSLAQLRHQALSPAPNPGRLSLREVIANVQHLHRDPQNTGALFQVASQFNLLEMTGPSVTPEQGIGIYENDHTQGPACAIAAGAGTIYRNYFAPVNGHTGQSAHHQIDCLVPLGQALGNTANRLWEMRNGYALPSRNGLAEIARRLQAASESERDALRQLLHIGIQWNTEVTLPGGGHTVSQAYCSALPVAYSGHPPAEWEPFARLVLEAAYEATLCTAIRNGSPKLFLTLLGGGAFGNHPQWILDALERALTLYEFAAPLQVAIVSHGAPKPFLQPLLARFSA